MIYFMKINLCSTFFTENVDCKEPSDEAKREQSCDCSTYRCCRLIWKHDYGLWW